MGLLSFISGHSEGLPGEKGKNGLGKAAKENSSGIKSFKYQYMASRGGDSYSYQVEEKDGKIVFTFESMLHREFENMSMECDQEILNRLYELYKAHSVARWEGFDKYNPQMLDGNGFSLEIVFNDGKKLCAEGSNAYPKGYREFVMDMKTILEPLEKSILEIKKTELKKSGIKGDLNSIIIKIIQKGSSGENEYSFFIIDDKYRKENCEIEIKSVSEEYFPKGEGKYYLHVPYKELDFSEVVKMIEAYNLLDWYDYDEHVEDPNNAEWFQVHFGFSDGMKIDACGTKHPENYDDFRDAFLIWVRGIWENYRNHP